MKKFTQSLLLVAASSLSLSAMAADPLAGTQWTTYDGGSITDPENGKSYSMAATLKGASLDVRGYLGVKALGRTQTWKKS